MDRITQLAAAGAASSVAAAAELYVDDVFSTYLYEGNSSTQTISNGIRLGDAVTGLSGYSIYATQGGNYTSVVPSGAAWQSVITDGILSGNNDNYVYSGGSVLDIYVDLVDRAVATAVKIAPQGDIGINAVYNTPSSLTVYGSNDASSWTTLDTNTGLSSSNFTEGSFTTFSFSNSTGYRYYRIAAPAATAISEWELVATSETASEGGLVWVKNRTLAERHALFDTERGKEYILASNETSVPRVRTFVSSFNSDGFSYNTSDTEVNNASHTYASWTFRKAPGFFDVVTYTGTGVNRTVAHSLGSVPGTIMVKRTDTTADWQVYHRSLANTEYLVLNSTAAKATGTTRWNSTTPTSTVFSLGTDATVNASGGTYVAYIFAHDDQSFGTNGDESIIKCGSFTGTGFVNIGWEPQWILIKPYTQTYNWEIYDNMRGMSLPGGSGGGANALKPNTSDAEAAVSGISFEATGFTQTTFGVTYPCIYMAIRRPHKPPTAATEVFNTVTYTGDGTSDRLIDSGITTDLFWTKARTTAFSGWFSSVDRMRGSNKELRMNGTGAEISFNYFANFDQQTGVEVMDVNNNYNQNGEPTLNYHFRRAPGFFDVVAYTGTGSARTVAHNLGVTPELMIVKGRTYAGLWYVYASGLGIDYRAQLNTSSQFSSGSSAFLNATVPTATSFSLGTSTVVNGSGYTYIAYLFASLDGISKVGSYSGTGSNVDVDCGFTAGARFVLIKRTDSTGDWYVWDTERGIVSGNDPYLLINSDAAEVTTTDYIDPLNAGFTVTSSAPAALNASGGTYIFLAIA